MQIILLNFFKYLNKYYKMCMMVFAVNINNNKKKTHNILLHIQSIDYISKCISIEKTTTNKKFIEENKNITFFIFSHVTLSLSLLWMDI